MAIQYPYHDAEGNFDFSRWRADQDAARGRIRSELARMLNGGATIWESFAGNRDWTLDLSAPTSEQYPTQIYTHESCNRSRMGYRTGEALAEHLENRMYGFGATLYIYCLTCGDEWTRLPTAREVVSLPDFELPEACPKCADKLRHYAEVSAEEARIESGQARWSATGSTSR